MAWVWDTDSAMNKTRTIFATVAGYMWMPSALAWKHVDVKMGDKPFEQSGNLRDVVLHITNDGDFSSCSIVEGSLRLRRTRNVGSSTVTRERYFDLAFFPSIADCMADDKLREAYEDRDEGCDDEEDVA